MTPFSISVSSLSLYMTGNVLLISQSHSNYSDNLLFDYRANSFKCRIGARGGVGTLGMEVGVFSEFIKVTRDQVIEVPEHLEDHQAAAWPLAGVTAWR